jgi:hypothetical protein
MFNTLFIDKQSVLLVRVIFCAMVCMLLLSTAVAQPDTTRNKIINHKLSQKALGTIKRKPKPDVVTTAKAEDPFLPYEGKIVRHITINKVGFEKSIYDSSRTFRNAATRIANRLHTNTREGVIRDNLFFKENKPVNPHRLADNERYLRDLDFILDSKIEICAIEGTEDSVDVEVYVRDVFSIGFKIDPKDIESIETELYDANLLGMGQRIQLNTLIDMTRTPQTGIETFYRKSSVGGSLINASAGYTQLNTGRSYGSENEHAYFLRLDRPLVSPYSRLAGGLEVSKNYSSNNYQRDEADFRRYHYHLEDGWIGYNMGVTNTTNARERHFLSLRYFNQNFERKPSQPAEATNTVYNNQQFVLGAITFYEQNFYKTQYVYGFGRTEDIPYGKTLSFTGGWSSELGRDRSYLGMNTQREFVSSRGNFYRMAAGGGSFFTDDRTEDTFIYANASYYSRLFMGKYVKVRQLVEGGYAQAFNNTIRPLITLNSQLQGFSPDSLFGFKRIFLRTETTVFTNWRWLGFQVAGFAAGESALLKQKQGPDVFDKLVWGLNGGVRIRNENLIFGTIELRGFYFPVQIKGVDTFGFSVSTNVRLKYTSVFVRPPNFVTYN